MSTSVDNFLAARTAEDAAGDALVAENNTQASTLSNQSDQIVALQAQVSDKDTTIANQQAQIVALQDGTQSLHDKFVALRQTLTTIETELDALLNPPTTPANDASGG